MRSKARLTWGYGARLVALSVLSILVAACSGAPSNTLVPPTVTSTPVASSIATPRPIATAAPTATSAPTATFAPTAAPTQITAAQSGSPLAGAIAKTNTAKVLRISAKMTVLGAIAQFIPVLPTDKEVILIGMEAEFNGKDSHQKQTGIGALLFIGDLDKTLETIEVGGKTYVHGPVPDLGAPADKWYLLDASSGVSLGSEPPDTLDQLISSNGGDWSHFNKTRSGEKLDGKTCDVYAADPNAFADSWQAMNTSDPAGWVADSGTAELTVCDDGYLHSFSMKAQVHDKTSADKKGQVTYMLHYNDFNANIVITAPAGAVPASTNNGNPTAVPTAKATTTGSGSSGAAGYDGEWKGTSSTDDDISFDVENNQITYVDLSYTLQMGSCMVGGSYSTPVKVAISNKSFTVQLTSSDGKQFIFTGSFTSNTEASGTLQIKGPASSCGSPVDSKTTWTASTGTAAATPTKMATSVPIKLTASPTPSSKAPADAATLVANFFNQVNAKNVDAALALFDNGFIVNWGASNTFMDKASLKTFLNSQTSRGVTYKASNVQAVGGTIVNFSLQESGGGSAAYSSSSAIVSSGKISILTIK